MAGALLFARFTSRPLRTSWLIVGIEYLHLLSDPAELPARVTSFRAGNRFPPAPRGSIALLWPKVKEKGPCAARKYRAVSRTSLKRSTRAQEHRVTLTAAPK